MATSLSVIVITRNEAARLRDCLESVRFADEVVMVDSGSTDDTVAIARSMGARVIQTADWPGFGPQKNRALALATGDWILSLDADERVTSALREEILATLETSPAAVHAWSMPRRSSVCGHYMAHSGWYPDRVIRLFRRRGARFSDSLVHERVIVDGAVEMLANDLLHDTYPDLETMLDKVNRYSSASAAQMASTGTRGSVAGAVLRGLWAFLRTYVLRLGFLDGRMGFVLAVSIAEGTYYKYIKLWARTRPPRSPVP